MNANRRVARICGECERLRPLSPRQMVHRSEVICKGKLIVFQGGTRAACLFQLASGACSVRQRAADGFRT